MSDYARVMIEVWAFRKKYGDVWKTPDKLSSLRYAFSEIGECYSEYMRECRQADFRNNPKEPSLGVELADAVIMLITAADTEKGASIFYSPDYLLLMDDGELLDHAGMHTAIAVNKVRDGGSARLNIYLALAAIERLCMLRGWDVSKLVALKLLALEAKIEGAA
jgi:hypothetical protein